MKPLLYRDPLRSQNHSAKVFAEWLNELRNQSGAYVIRDRRTHTVLYIGESHTGQLAKTIKRHFYKWPDDANRKHFTTKPDRVEVAVRLTPPGTATAAQDNLIQRLQPSENRLEPVPF